MQVKADSSLCLTDLAGNVDRCVDQPGATQTGSDAEPSQTATGSTSNLSGLSDADLIALQQRITDELERRLRDRLT